MLSVEEMLQIPSLEGLTVIAGEGGLKRQISTVSVMDALDIYKWMRGGEFLITSGSPLKEEPEYLSMLLGKLDEGGASAFGIKTERFIGEIPEEAIKAADRLGFPLIYIPGSFAFTDIINPVLEEVISRQARQLQYSEKIHKSFTALALKEKPAEKILETLEQIIQRKAAFIDTQLMKMFVPNRQDLFYEELLRSDHAEEGYDYYRKNYKTYEISNESTNYGMIILGEDSSISLENQSIALEHAGTILILDVQKRMKDEQMTSRFRDEFIHDIIYNNINTEAEFNNRAHLYHWDYSKGGVVVIVDIDNFKRQYVQKLDDHKNMNLEIHMHMMFRTIMHIVKNQFQQVAYSKMNDYVVFIIRENEEWPALQLRIQKVFKEVQTEVLKKTGFTATVAVGRAKSLPMELHISYEEAKKCIYISHNLQISNQIIFYEKLGIYKLINLMIGTVEAEELLEEYIYKLKAHDIKNGNSLVETFISICESLWNLKVSSSELFVHYNTVKYRFGKITQILNTDFKSIDDRVNAEIAIRIYQITR